MAQNINMPENIRCSKSHEYIIVEGDAAKVGITKYAADQLGEIVYVELPEVGAKFNKGEVFGTVESVKAASELYMPISGEILELNDDLTSEPELINEDCYNRGWIVKVKNFSREDLNNTMSVEDYNVYIEE